MTEFNNYIKVYDKQITLTATYNREIYRMKLNDKNIYTAEYIESFLRKDPMLKKTEHIFALYDTCFLLFAASKGCCDLKWPQMFAELSPKQFADATDEAYNRVSKKFPKVLEEYNKLYKKTKEMLETNGMDITD